MSQTCHWVGREEACQSWYDYVVSLMVLCLFQCVVQLRDQSAHSSALGSVHRSVNCPAYASAHVLANGSAPIVQVMVWVIGQVMISL
jgi:hypothetical protein